MERQSAGWSGGWKIVACSGISGGNGRRNPPGTVTVLRGPRQHSTTLGRSPRWFQRCATHGATTAAVNMARYFPSDIPLRSSAHTPGTRSEEHTSELQSQSNLVCRLLLEKKKNTIDEPRIPLNHSHTSQSTATSGSQVRS